MQTCCCGIFGILVVAMSGALAQATPVDTTGYALSGSTNVSSQYNADDATVTSITTAAGTVSSFISPTEANVTSAPGFVFAGDAETLAVNDTATQELSVLGNVPTRGWAGGGTNGVVDVLFGQTIVDNAAGADTVYEIFALELGGGDDITIEAIIGGTVGAPVLSGSPVTVTTSTPAGQPEVAVTVSNNTDSTWQLGGSAFDLSDDLGVTSLIGLRYSTTDGADISVLLANAASVENAGAVPEPSTTLLLGLGLVGLCFRRRRDRR